MLNNDQYNKFIAFVLTIIILLVIYNFYKKEFTPMVYGLIGLLIFLLLDIIITYSNVSFDISKVGDEIRAVEEVVVPETTQSEKEAVLTNNINLNMNGPFDGLSPDEMTSRLQYLYHATSNPHKQTSYLDYKTEHDNMIQRDNSSLSSGDQLMLEHTSSFYPDLTENQINARDCMNEMGPNSCFQSPRMFQSINNGNQDILSGGLNETNVKSAIREDFSCPGLVSDTNPLDALFINAPGKPNTKQYDITDLPCRGCTTDSCRYCHEHNELFI